MKPEKVFFITLLFFLGFNSTHAQEALDAAGGDALGSGGSSSFSVGQLFYSNQESNSGSINEGVQQAFEISVISGIEEGKYINLEMTVYPNPTTDILIISVKGYTNENLSYELIDQSGKLVKNKNLEEELSYLTVKDLVSMGYFLIIKEDSQIIKTFKIIKN